MIRTEYAIASLVDKDAVKAGSALKAFEKAAKSYPYPVEIETERELIRTAGNMISSED